MTDTRWKQRMQNFGKALRLLNESTMLENPSVLEQEGMVQRFEYTFELAWKTMKDLLHEKGIDSQFPRDVLKSAFQAGLVADGEIWLDMLENRNQLSHTYDEATFTKSVAIIEDKYLPELNTLYHYLETQV